MIKIKFDNSNILNKIIKENYDKTGKIKNVINSIHFKNGDTIYTILNGLTHHTDVKLLNNILNGSMKFSILHKENEIELKPKSRYFIKNNNKYTFY